MTKKYNQPEPFYIVCTNVKFVTDIETKQLSLIENKPEFV